jgi:hypothetical protein
VTGNQIEHRRTARVCLIDAAVALQRSTGQADGGDRRRKRARAGFRCAPQAKPTRQFRAGEFQRNAARVGIGQIASDALTVGDTSLAEAEAVDLRARAATIGRVTRSASTRRLVRGRALHA